MSQIVSIPFLFQVFFNRVNQANTVTTNIKQSTVNEQPHTSQSQGWRMSHRLSIPSSEESRSSTLNSRSQAEWETMGWQGGQSLAFPLCKDTAGEQMQKQQLGESQRNAGWVVSIYHSSWTLGQRRGLSNKQTEHCFQGQPVTGQVVGIAVYKILVLCL